MTSEEIVPRPGTMDATIIAEMRKDPYGVTGRVKAGDVVIDAGANIGAFARFVSSKAPGARLFCIEPMPSNLDALRGNLRDVPNCEIVAAALMGQPGSVVLHDYGAASSACHSILKLDVEAEGTLEVPAMTLPGIVEQYGLNHVDFLKLDVQGAEFDVIAGCPASLLGKINYIAMESHASIANTETLLGEVPEYRRLLTEMVRKLSQTHLCVRGYPARRGGVLIWARRASLGSAERIKHRLRLWVGTPFVCLKAFVLRFGAHMLPRPIKAAIRRVLNI